MRPSEVWRPGGRDMDKDTGYMTGYVIDIRHPVMQGVLFHSSRTEKQTVDLQYLH